jgi:hypothetical protein
MKLSSRAVGKCVFGRHFHLVEVGIASHRRPRSIRESYLVHLTRVEVQETMESGTQNLFSRV